VSDADVRFARWVRRIRGDRTQQEFGDLIGADKSTVSRWEAGQLPDNPALTLLLLMELYPREMEQMLLEARGRREERRS
jgi:DNA-binding transcriptional regulator YiaG